MNTWHIFDLEKRQVELENALEGPAADATDFAHLWVPSEYTSIHYVDVPTAPRRKWIDIIPWIECSNSDGISQGIFSTSISKG